MNTYFFRKNVLIAPLDWGIGHASRCLPLIKYLQEKEFKIFIAACGDHLHLIKKEFPGLTYIQLKGYNISYSKHKRWLWAKILWQIPKIILTIKKENTQIEAFVQKYKINVVISDNRFGLYTNKCYCIFITHQLTIEAPIKRLQNFIQQINYNFINRFNECWVPDFEGEKNIAGILSHPVKMPAVRTKYLGPLSRFTKTADTKIIYKYLIALSGPEPQRTILEEKLKKIIPHLNGNILMVRGKPGLNDDEIITKDLTIKNHLLTKEMQQAFMQSEYIISRAGYTTIMELLSLQKKSILIPTPAQTEQEYLAQHLYKQHWCYTCNQHDDLLYHIQQAENFNYQLPQLDEPVYKTVIDELDVLF